MAIDIDNSFTERVVNVELHHSWESEVEVILSVTVSFIVFCI